MSRDVSNERTRNYLVQIKGAVVYKAVAVLASFLAIPLMIRYLGQEQFGVWSTLLSVMSWIVFFDLGVGNGLRNKVAEALARNDKKEAADYIATGYSLVGLGALALWVMVTAVSFFVPWQTVFNTQAISESTLQLTVQVAVFFVVLNFWIGLISALLGSVQKTSMTALGQLISNVLALLSVFVLAKTTDSTITYLALAYGLSLVTANIVLSFWFYKQHSDLRPTPSLDKKHIRPLLSLGLKFFIIQLAVLVIFTTDKMLITQLFGPQYVTQYDVVFKLFSVITFAHTLISAPLWSAYTDAYRRGDMLWIKHMLRKQLIIFIGVSISTIVLGFFSRQIISLWIGHEINIPNSLILTIGIFAVVSTWNNIFAMFVNGIGDIKLQLYTAVAAMFLNIPLSLFFVKYLAFGLSGIVMGTIVSLLLASIILPIQVYRIMRLGTKAIPV